VAATVNIDAYSDALVVLGTAAVVVPVLRRVGVSQILAYFGAGAVLGPFGLGSFVKSFPLLFWFTVSDAAHLAGIADLGVVFLLFVIGLELSLTRLVTMRRLVFGLGGLQVLLTTAALSGVAVAAGAKPDVALLVGASLALSSTAIVLDILSSQERLTSGVGRAAFSVLLAQDLAVIPILVFVSVLGLDSGGSVLTKMLTALAQAAVGVTIILLFGRFLLRPLFHLVAGSRSAELFIAAVLFVVVGSGVVAHQAGVSMALGAFIAGLMLAETEYGKAIQATIEPFKGLLLGIFFFTVGMAIDLREFAREPLLLAAAIAGLIALKATILSGLGRLFGLSWIAAAELGLLLGPGGEFAFVSIGTASALGLVASDVSGFALATTSATMALTPPLAAAARRLRAAWAAPQPRDPELAARPPGGEKHAIVVGYGRVGKVVCALLGQHGIRYIAVDFDAASVARDRRHGHAVYYGDAADPGFLETCGIKKAAGLIITVHTQSTIDKIVDHARAVRPDLLIVARARDAEHARHLYAIGATDAVPETIEASLQLSEAALVGLGVATGLAIASIHEKRDEFRHTLQQAARAAGLEETRALRPKSRRRL
jgi:CPA2 family monovalent cation:H+ antiporter-2